MLLQYIIQLFFSPRLNEYTCLKLSLVSEIVAEIPLLQMMQEEQSDEKDGESFTQQQSAIMAALSFIGSDDSRCFIIDQSRTQYFVLILL